MSPTDPLTTPPPSFSSEEAASIAADAFGIRGEISPLDSERDQNFLLDDGNDRYVLKIANRADDPAVLEMQAQAALHIAEVDPSLPVMQPIPTTDGAFLGEAGGCVVRLFTRVPGTMVAANELDRDAVRHFGGVVARMGLALRGFFHAAAGYRILWDLKYSSDLRKLLPHVTEERTRGLLEEVLGRFDANVADVLPHLRAQVVHNDLTVDNVLFDREKRVAGIVDLGDATHTALVCDLAIALASVMWGRDDPIEAAAAAISGYERVVMLEEAETAVLGDLILARLAASVLIASWRVSMYPENTDYIVATRGVATTLLGNFDAIGFDAFSRRIASACTASNVSEPRAGLLQRRRNVLGPALSPPTYTEPLYLVRGDGPFMYDDTGRRFLDAYNNVPVVGHGHPKVAAAIAAQSATLSTNTRYLHHALVELAERIVASMPDELDTVLFYNSGSEANDVAWRFARHFTGASGAVVSDFAYHGVTSATIALSPEEWGDDRPSHVDTFAPPPGGRSVAAAIAALSERGHGLATCFFDSLFTSDGIYEPSPGFMRELVTSVHDAGGLVVADEVQCGYGRNGLTMWSFETAGIVPDFVTLGKPMGNGYPVAAVVVRRDIAERFADDTDIFSTFGGNPVAARAALAVLDVIEEEDLVANAGRVGAHLRGKLASLSHPAVRSVRGAGLMIGVELNSGDDARVVMDAMKDAGVLVGRTGRGENVLKIRPPLVIDLDDADRIVDALSGALPD